MCRVVRTCRYEYNTYNLYIYTRGNNEKRKLAIVPSQKLEIV